MLLRVMHRAQHVNNGTVPAAPDGASIDTDQGTLDRAMAANFWGTACPGVRGRVRARSPWRARQPHVPSGVPCRRAASRRT